MIGVVPDWRGDAPSCLEAACELVPLLALEARLPGRSTSLAATFLFFANGSSSSSSSSLRGVSRSLSRAALSSDCACGALVSL
eukprot:3501877-Rhodomonas_salina.1